MWPIVLVAVLAVPAIVVLLIFMSLTEEGLDETRRRLARRPEVARRLPHHRGLWKAGGVSCSLALLPVAVGIKGADSGQWEVLGLVSAGLLLVGSMNLGLWWFLAGRRAETHLKR
jgi:hypothetical protein